MFAFGWFSSITYTFRWRVMDDDRCVWVIYI
jgi:hypothetical protein